MKKINLKIVITVLVVLGLINLGIFAVPVKQDNIPVSFTASNSPGIEGYYIYFTKLGKDGFNMKENLGNRTNFNISDFSLQEGSYKLSISTYDFGNGESKKQEYDKEFTIISETIYDTIKKMFD